MQCLIRVMIPSKWFWLGSVNCKYLVAYHGWDDDFDTDNGFSGKCSFVWEYGTGIADQSISNGFRVIIRKWND